MKFQNEKNFYLINKLNDLDKNEELIKYKEKEIKDNNGLNEVKDENDLIEKEKEEKGIIRSREFAIFDSNNQIHIINSDTFEHFSNEYNPVQ